VALVSLPPDLHSKLLAANPDEASAKHLVLEMAWALKLAGSQSLIRATLEATEKLPQQHDLWQCTFLHQAAELCEWLGALQMARSSLALSLDQMAREN
jgi:hypothetical protein